MTVTWLTFHQLHPQLGQSFPCSSGQSRDMSWYFQMTIIQFYDNNYHKSTVLLVKMWTHDSWGLTLASMTADMNEVKSSPGPTFSSLVMATIRSRIWTQKQYLITSYLTQSLRSAKIFFFFLYIYLWPERLRYVHPWCGWTLLSTVFKCSSNSTVDNSL